MNDIARGRKSIADLEVLDYICGNTDRHGKNILFQFNPVTKKLCGVQGIDNDAAFGLFTDENGGGRRFMFGPREMPAISADVAEKVMALTPETLKFALRGFDLSNAELDAAGKRLQTLQKFVLEGEKYYEENKKLDTDKKLHWGNGKIRIIQKDEWGRLDNDIFTAKRVNPETKMREDGNLFNKVREGVILLPRDHRERERDYQSLKSDIAVGVENRALLEGQKRENARANTLLATVASRTSGNRTSLQYEAMRDALREYCEFQEKLTKRISRAQRRLNGLAPDPDEPQNIMGGPEEEAPEAQKAKDVMDSIVSTDDLMLQQRLCDKIKDAAEAYLQHKGGGLHLPYANRRIAAARQVRELGKQGIAIKKADYDMALANEKEAIEQIRRIHGDRAEIQEQKKTNELIPQK